MADGGAADPRARLVPYDACDYDPGNPRRSSPDEEIDTADLDGLIKFHGILVPLLAERNGAAAGRYLIIEGERRHRSAGKVGRREDVPVIVLDDMDAESRLELQIASYARAPMGPLQEARAYKRLLDAFSIGAPVTPVTLAERLGKRPADIRRRLLLLDLVPGAQELLGTSGINLDVGQRIAGLSPQGQDAVVARAKSYLTAMPDRAPLRHADLAGIIEDQRRRLDNVPWKLDDATLPGGACSSCPKRTSAQAALFGDTVEGDECQDTRCFADKGAAWRERRNDAEAERTVGPTKAAAGKEAKESAFKAPKTKTPSPAGTVAPAGDDGGARAKREAAEKADHDATVCVGVAVRAEEEIESHVLAALVGWAARVVSDDARALVAERRGLDGSPLDALLFMASPKVAVRALRGLLAELLAAELRQRGGEAADLPGRWAEEDYGDGTPRELPKPAERVTGKSRAKPDPQAIPCEACLAKIGAPCTNIRGKPGPLHAVRVTAAGKKLSIEKAKAEEPAQEVLRTARETPDPCPLTRADILRLGASIGMRATPHEGAHSPENVWGCVKLVREHPPDAVATREALYRLSPNSGTESFDLAIAYLLETGEARRVSGKKGAPKEVLVLGEAARAEATKPGVDDAGGAVWLDREDCAEAETLPCSKCGAKKGGRCLSDKGKLGTGWVHRERDEARRPIVDRDVKPDNMPPSARCKVCGCSEDCADDHESNTSGECEIELVGPWAGVCTVCARCCAVALKIAASKVSPTALEKALTTPQKDGRETWDKTRARAAWHHLQELGALGETNDGKLLASQPPK